jgi:hypothetical protein
MEKQKKTTDVTIDFDQDSDDETRVIGLLKGGGDGAEMCGMCGLATLSIALILYSVGLFIFGIVAVATDDDAQDSDNVPTHADKMWIICVLFVVNWGITTMAGCAKSQNSDGESESTPLSRVLNFIALVLGLICWIWGLVIFSNLDTAAKDFMEDNFNLLWLYFQMCIWTATAAWCIIILVLIVGLVIMCFKD